MAPGWSGNRVKPLRTGFQLILLMWCLSFCFAYVFKAEIVGESVPSFECAAGSAAISKCVKCSSQLSET